MILHRLIVPDTSLVVTLTDKEPNNVRLSRQLVARQFLTIALQIRLAYADGNDSQRVSVALFALTSAADGEGVLVVEDLVSKTVSRPGDAVSRCHPFPPDCCNSSWQSVNHI